tara:strand:- start:986 stop:1822 length:837 start_codon:yes stop_codon:yes gene_type:complete
MELKKIYLESEEYYHDIVTKKTIYLHHTAGSHRPDWTVANWERDKTKSGGVRHIATAYVIGGKSTRDGNTKWDGTVIECHPPEKWAHHLGIKARNNRTLNKESIGLEICNYGPIKVKDGEYFNYVNSRVPKEDVIDLGFTFKGYRHYHAYTDAQIESTRQLIHYLSDKFDIDVAKGMKRIINKSLKMPEDLDLLGKQKWLNIQGYLGANGRVLAEDGIDGRNTQYAVDSYLHDKKGDAFALNKQALVGAEGVWTHTNVRKDKFDLSPQPKLIEMLSEL